MGVIGAGGTMGQALMQMLRSEEHSIIGCGRTLEKRELILSMANKFTISIKHLLADSDVVFVALKPQVFKETTFLHAFPSYNNPLIVSVMAGISMAELREKLCTKRIIRTMPNLGMTVGAGVTAWMADEGASEEDKKLIADLFDATGAAVELREENMFHTFTALTGSGPGLLAQICSWFAQAAIEYGLSAQEAELLTWSVLQGMTKLQEAGISFEELRTRVTSPNGTTHHGLQALCNAGVEGAMKACFDAARRQSEELGEGGKTLSYTKM